MKFQAVYYEEESLQYPLGKQLKEKLIDLPWISIESHNRIAEMQQKENSEFGSMKQNLIIGIRKTHKYVENYKISNYLVPYTSSGCTAMCLYCYLVCNYNKCAYLRLFVNREQMFDKIVKQGWKASVPQCFEIGSNSDLIMENMLTGNLEWTIAEFGKKGRGALTFPTKFHMVEPLLSLDHQGKIIFRMSVNPSDIIKKIELGTSSLDKRIGAVNQMCDAGYPVGLLIAPVILGENWKEEYGQMLTILGDRLNARVKKTVLIEIILMTYSYIHRAINGDAFPNAPELYDKDKMTGRGRGKYCYRPEERADAEQFFGKEVEKIFGKNKIVYIS